MATAILLGVAAYLCLAGPVAIIIGRMLAGPERAALSAQRAAGLAGDARVAPTEVAVRRPVALVAGHPHTARDLQKARAEAHPAHA